MVLMVLMVGGFGWAAIDTLICTFMCTIAERNGPYIQFYIPPEDNFTEVVNNVAFNQLNHKVERVIKLETM